MTEADASARRVVRSAGTAFLWTWVTACNAILGISEPEVIDAAVESQEPDTSLGKDGEAGEREPKDAESSKEAEASSVNGGDAPIHGDATIGDESDAAPLEGDDGGDAAHGTAPEAGRADCPSSPCPQALLPQEAAFAPWRMVMDATYLYWTEVSGGRIGRTPKTPGETKVLWQTDITSPDGIAVDETSVYWVDTQHAVWRCPKEGCGAGPTLVSFNGTTPFQIAVDARNVYWTDKSNWAVRTAPKDGVDAGFATLWQSDAAVPQYIAVDLQGRLFFTADDGRLYRMSTDGGAPTAFGAVASAAGAGVALDTNAAYWAVRDETVGTINIVAKDGTTSATLASSQAGPLSVASDGTDLYWINNGTTGADGAILTCSIAACGSPTALVRDIPYPRVILVDDVAIYWVEDLQGQHGSIWRMEKKK